MTRIMIVGSGGQLGHQLVRMSWPASFELHPLDSSSLDITDASSVSRAVRATRPDVIVNAAAYTAVDRAEDEEDLALRVNADAVRHLATAADAADALLVHISSDYVFDGSKPGWYEEGDSVCPLSAYGRTKAAGEQAAGTASKSITLRTSWVYSPLGANFVTTMLRLAGERDELGVVGDQIGCPTSAADLAEVVRRVVDATSGGSEAPPCQLYHAASPDSATWYEFAQAIFRTSTKGFAGVCSELTTAEYPTRAIRPANSRLSSDKLDSDLRITLPSWRESLPRVISEIESTYV